MNCIRRTRLPATGEIEPFVNRVRCGLNFVGRRLLAAGLALCLASTAWGLEYSALTRALDSAHAARYAVFQNFQIKGICGSTRLDLAAAYGANTIRTYTPPTRAELDEYQRLGFKVIVGIWMPNQGENSGKNNVKWNFDYRQQVGAQLKDFEATLDRIGNHPAILMWCLGNEVHLDPAYLETVNRMSLALHRRFPKQLTSLTMVNAPREKIALIKQSAPDLDVIGFNSYGQGAVGSASQNLETEWGRAYYVSEFGPQGPWWGRKTAWGEVYEQSYDAKLDDLRKSFQKIDAAPHCLGSTMFLWGCWTQQKPTYFSAFLSPQGTAAKQASQQFYLTPMTDEFCHYWSGQYPPERAPVLTQISVAGQTSPDGVVVPAGKIFKVNASAVAPSTTALPLHYRWWILNRRGDIVAGPADTDQPTAELMAPLAAADDYSVMAYVIAGEQRASGFTLPIKVETEKKAVSAQLPQTQTGG